MDPESFRLEGLHIQRRFQKHSLLTRRQADLEYGRVAAAVMEQFRPDVVFSANMPLDAQRILLEATHRQGAKFVFWMQDVYSVAAAFVLRKKVGPLAGLGKLYFERLEKKLLRQSDAIVCIADGFAEYVQRWRIPAEKICVIENWAPLDEILPTARNNPWAVEQGTVGKFCFLYSGTLGMKHRPERLLELAAHLARRGDARLIVIAGGAGADWLAAHAHTLPAGALTLLPFQPYERLSEVMGAADVLITLLDAEAGIFAVPSKTLAYLCAARAILMAAPLENAAAHVVRRAQAGLVISSESHTEFLRTADQLLSNPDLCREYGSHARAYAERTFRISAIADRFLEAVRPVCPAASDVHPVAKGSSF
jgi:colanic acid biosynthesis glycosyl transferase WcaI